MIPVFGLLINGLGLPGFVQPFEEDEISIRTSSRYTILKVGEREFYFIRETGKYDGWGRNA